MDKRENLLSLVEGNRSPEFVPAAFFLHFPAQFHAGQAAVEKHLEYFRYTGMDFVKIQYEANFPHLVEIQTPDDWARMPFYGLDFYAGQLKAVEGLVKAAKKEAVIVQTLYSPFMCAGHTTSDETLTSHLDQQPDKVRKGLEVITDSLLQFVRACMRLGVDGFYTSTQGGEAGRFTNPGVFEQYVKPFDLTLMNEVNQTCRFNILHVCDYGRDYADFSPFLEYPGHVVNCPLKLGDRQLSPTEAARMFARPYMGGMERLGVIATGTPEQVRQAAEAVLTAAPEKFILGADCTVPNDTPWDNLKAAIETAHAFQQH
jgi:uroporphyrinogen decarboxylase